MLKWRMLLTTTPVGLLMAALTYARESYLQLPALVEFSDLSPAVSALAFIIGFMLAGVLADHKESERIPGDLSSTLDSVLYVIDAMAAVNGERDAPALRQAHLNLARLIEDYLVNGRTPVACFGALREMNRNIAQSAVAEGLQQLGASAVGSLVLIRRAIARINTIRTTIFVPAGYAILSAATIAVLGMLVFTSFRNEASQFLVPSMLAVVLVYLLRLIADLDGPFEYSNGTYLPDSSEVSPMPVVNFRLRLEQELMPPCK